MIYRGPYQSYELTRAPSRYRSQLAASSTRVARSLDLFSPIYWRLERRGGEYLRNLCVFSFCKETGHVFSSLQGNWPFKPTCFLEYSTAAK